MAWVKLDDQFPTHPKIIEVGGDAAWLHVCALCYCGQHLTDGLVPKAIVGRLSDRDDPQALVARLVEVGVWIDRGDRYEIHDYLEHNPSREHVLAEREKRSVAGKRNASKRWQTDAKSHAKSHASSHASSHGESHTICIDNVDAPGPSPIEEPKGSSAKTSAKVRRDALFDALVDVFGPATMRSRASHYGKCVTELVAHGVDPDDVRRRGAILKAKFDTPSPEALMRWWDELDQPGFGNRPQLGAAKALLAEGAL